MGDSQNMGLISSAVDYHRQKTYPLQFKGEFPHQKNMQQFCYTVLTLNTLHETVYILDKISKFSASM